MQYGFFEDTNKEYVITRPDTPRPWSNYIGSAEFGGVITNNAAGYTFYKSATQGRLSRYRFNDGPGNLSGRYIYLRDETTGDFWTNSWAPVCKPRATFDYECRHGSGYTQIKSTYAGITSEVTYFVPLGKHYEIWSIRLVNNSDQPRKIKVFPFVEPQCNWSAMDDMNNLQYNQYIAHTQRVGEMIDIGSNVNMPAEPENFTNKDQARHTFFGLAGIEAKNFDADLTAFLGAYGSYARPAAVLNGACSGSTASGDMGCAAYEIELELAPGQSRSLACVFGVGTAAQEGRAAVAETDTPQKIAEALAAVKAHWHSRIETLTAQTPDPAFNSLLNMWAPFNSLMTFYWSRTASLVYAGERDGLGFRDTLQDFMASASLVPEETRACLELMLTGQYAHGGAKPVVQPFHHHPGKEPLSDHYRSDDGLWFFNCVPEFVKEVGDLDFYNKVLPFADQGEATVLGHLRRALEFNLERSGGHGLPCGLTADWNDCLHFGEEGETVFVAFQLRLGLREYISICNRLGESKEADWATAKLSELDRNLQAHAWDGEWYLRAYRSDGLKFGSKECDEGTIFMNPQCWAVLSGHATGERAEQVMESMHKQLATDYGVMICTPPYVSTDPQVCLARLMNPGMKENGGIFNHTQGWGVMAAAELGMGDRAWEYMRNVMPSSFNDRAEIREVEPYAVCQSTHSRFSPRYGAGRLSWLSGSAAWNYFAMTHSILGIQPDYDGLRIDPCICSEWEGFTATREFRGATYNIRVKNPNGKCKGVTELVVDGKTMEGNLVPLAEPGAVVEVVATLSG